MSRRLRERWWMAGAVTGDLRDERIRDLHMRSVALAGWLVTVATVVGFMVQVARGRSGAPFDWLAAIGGFSYLAAYLRGLRR